MKKTAMPDLQYNIKLYIFNCGFSAKVACAFIVFKKQWRNLQILFEDLLRV